MKYPQFIASLWLVAAVTLTGGPALGSTLPAPRRPTPSTLRCTLNECLQMARDRSPLMAAARLGLNQYASKLREAESVRYPKLELNVFGSALPELKPGKDGSTPLEDYDFTQLGPLVVGSLGMGQTLFTFGKLSALHRLAERGVDIAQTTMRVAEDELRYQLSRVWWGLVLSADLRDLVQDAKRMLAEQRKKVEGARDADDGSFNQADLLKLNVFSADIESKIRQFERNKALAEDGLRLALDADSDVPVEAAGELTAVQVPPVPVEAMVALAQANAPRLLAQRQGVLARLIQVDMAYNQLWPDLVFVARYAYTYSPTRMDTPDSLAANPTNSATSGLGLVLRWSLDIKRQLEKVEQADLDARQAKHQLAYEEAKLAMDVRQMVREMDDARAMIEIQERAYKSARGWLNSENQAYEDGFQEFTEVLRAMEAYSTKRLAWAESIYNYNLAVAALSRAVGMDLGSLQGRGL